MWRLQNDMAPAARVAPKRDESDDLPVFTEVSIDVRPEPATTAAASLRRF
jgi:twitching motility protein PilU